MHRLDSKTAQIVGKACRIHRFGGPEAIVVEDVALPPPGQAEVLVRVKAAGVGPWDTWIRSGNSALPQPLPLTLGSELCGIVEAVGQGVLAFAPGDAVFGVTNARFTGACAEFAIAEVARLARKPASLADADAASTPVVAVTAWQALFEYAEVSAGQTVIVLGAAGSVGAYAVQLARQAGAHVIAGAGEKDFGFVRAFGADQVFDPRVTPAFDPRRAVDAVIDLVGGGAQAAAAAWLRPGGTLISAVSQPDVAHAPGIKAAFFLVDVTTERLDRIAALLASGALKTSVGAVLPLASLRVAHEMLEGTRPRPRGKIVLAAAD